ncbi:MAG TPA: S8 family serine peptidase [Solirubrobacteraceae bacterium]|jgi:serine protease AprX|nr:S8 family serine peptidase [Solirubrobacteraceae bacterium]
MSPRRLLPLLALAATLAAAAPAAAAERIIRFDPKQTTRAQLRADLAQLGLRTAPLRRLPFAAVAGTESAVRRAATVEGVSRIFANDRLEWHLHESVNLIFGGAARREAAYAAGYDGSGQTVAIVDSGVDSTHADLRDRMVQNVKVLGTDGILTDDTFRHYVECGTTPCPADTTSGHGTHVASTTAGDGTASDGFYTGVAPGAGVVGIGTGEVIAVFHALQAFDYLLAHPELNVVAVNNSWGPSGGARFDATHPINVATKRLHDAGITVVFSAGNADWGGEDGSEPGEPEGSSDCSPQAEEDGEECAINPYGTAPWTIGVAATRKDHPGGPGDQPLALFSSRGDDDPQPSLDGSMTVSYQPTLSAPGVNIKAARAPTGATQLTCGASAEAPSCVGPKPEYDLFYFSSSGTSMAAPHVTGAVAVLQDAAQSLGRGRLTPDQVKALLVQTAAPMTKHDGLWDWPCGSAPIFVDCGADVDGTTGAPYASWQVGAGALDLGAALAAVQAGQIPRPAKVKKPKRRVSR